MSAKSNILILCTGNSCRSQMAEGYLRHFAGNRYAVHSAGMNPKDAVHPLAVQVMMEDGVNISEQHPKDIGLFLGRMAVRYLIVVCDKANDTCPRIFPGMLNRLFWPFDDPDEHDVGEFRRVRNQIKSQILTWLETNDDA